MFDDLEAAARIVAQKMAEEPDGSDLGAMLAAQDHLLEYIREFREGYPGGLTELMCASLIGAGMACQWKHDDGERQTDRLGEQRRAAAASREVEGHPQCGDYQAYLRHPVFWAATSVAIEKADGKCSCGAKASEVRHLRYPMGTFDLPSNLQPVCPDCRPPF